VGVKGARLTVTPRGTTYITVGGRGFYYRETISKGNGEPGHANNRTFDALPGAPTDEIRTAHVADLVDSSSERLVQQLNERARMNNPAVLLYSLAGLMCACALATSTTGLLVAAVVAVVAGLVVHKKNDEKRRSRLFYELDEKEQRKFGSMQESLADLGRSKRIWRIEGNLATSDWKRNAGASSLVRRTHVFVGKCSPRRVETNISVPCITMGKIQMFFLAGRDSLLGRNDVWGDQI
jgi:hypothetical protein